MIYGVWYIFHWSYVVVKKCRSIIAYKIYVSYQTEQTLKKRQKSKIQRYLRCICQWNLISTNVVTFPFMFISIVQNSANESNICLVHL